jgi:hypothetical protein
MAQRNNFLWEELTLVAINSKLNLDLPYEIDSGEKYSAFLQRVDTELKFCHFMHRTVVELRHINPDKVSLILEQIADHLTIIHEGNGEDFHLIVELLNISLVYAERLVRKSLDKLFNI